MAPTTASPKASTSTSSTKKRRAPPTDSRFAAFDSLSADEHDDVNEQESTTEEPLSFPRQPAPNPSSLPAHLLPSALAGNKSKKQPGLIYLSRIPPGMGPSKVKHLLSAYGEVGRVYLARADPDPPANAASSKKSRHQAEKHKEHKFAEGWVEFEDKRVARSVAEMLNAQTIGGKKGTRHRDDVWTMKYLPRFRWDMLSEQVALERATQTSLLRFHLQHSRTEQESYLSAVEKARVGRKIEEKAAGRSAASGGAEGEGKKRKAEGGEGAAGEEKKEKKKGRTYRQREPLAAGGAGAGEDGEGKRKGGTKKQLDDVLGRLF